MTVWPEGRMEFVCTGPAQEGGREQRWLGEVMVKSHSMGMAELIIYGRDSCINAVIGKYMSGLPANCVWPGRNSQQGYKMQHPEMSDNYWPQNGESCPEGCHKPGGE